MSRFTEFFEDENKKLSTNRLISLLLAVTGIGISIFLCFNGTFISELNITISILLGGAVGNRVISNIKKGNMEQSITTEKN